MKHHKNPHAGSFDEIDRDIGQPIYKLVPFEAFLTADIFVSDEPSDVGKGKEGRYNGICTSLSP